MIPADPTRPPHPTGRARFTTRQLSKRQALKWTVFFVLAPGIFASLMDEIGVFQALPRIADGFGSTIPQVQWVVLAYVLTIGALMVPMGRLSDIVGRRRVYMAGLAVFALGGLLSGFAPSLNALVLFKVIQGAGGAMIQATAMALVAGAFPARERGRAIGLFMLVAGAGGALGPIAGGAAVTYLGWRWMFFMSVPVVVASLALAAVALPRHKRKVHAVREPFDWAGALLATLTLVVFLLVMSNGSQWGWTAARSLGGFAVAGVAAVALVAWQLRARWPLIPPELFRRSVFTRGVVLTLLIIVGNTPAFFLMPFLLQGVMHRSPLAAGLVMSCSAVAATATGMTAGYLSDRHDWRIFVVAGTAVIMVVLIGVSFVGETTPIWILVVLMFGLGLGVGLWYTPTTSAALGSVPKSRYGVGSSVAHLARYTASLSAITLATTAVAVTMSSLGFEPTLDLTDSAQSSGLGGAFISGMSVAVRIGAGITFAAMLIALLPLGLRHSLRRPR
jgi:EmrB/QacA subfamily drug resistance transporter